MCDPIDLSSINIIDSRDIIERLEYLRGIKNKKRTKDEQQEFEDLTELEKHASDSPDWEHGEGVIAESCFTEYIKDLIEDCYDTPKEMNSGMWPWCHMKMDYESAAEAAKVDYIEFSVRAHNFLIRA